MTVCYDCKKPITFVKLKDGTTRPVDLGGAYYISDPKGSQWFIVDDGWVKGETLGEGDLARCDGYGAGARIPHCCAEGEARRKREQEKRIAAAAMREATAADKEKAAAAARREEEKMRKREREQREAEARKMQMSMFD